MPDQIMQIRRSSLLLTKYDPALVGDKWASRAYKYGPYLYHQFSCVVDANGKTTCGGQDRGEKGKGKPSVDTLIPVGGFCKETKADDSCFEQCLIDEWSKPTRPDYGIPIGTDCQEYDAEVNSKCEKACKPKSKWRW